MKRKLVLTIAVFGLGMFASNLFAQGTPKVHNRQVNQQERIQQGRKSGELTRGETVALEAEQAKIQHDKKAAKADGVVTPEERAKLKHEQRRANRHVYRQKHDGQSR
ncbi:MAG: hypothetical protein U0V74_14200 [Chitinophagales bacterium]